MLKLVVLTKVLLRKTLQIFKNKPFCFGYWILVIRYSLLVISYQQSSLFRGMDNPNNRQRITN